MRLVPILVLSFASLALGCSNPIAPPDGVALGIYNLATVDATNLELSPDQTFRWGIYGCDFGGGGAGRWEVDGDNVVLLPVAGEDTFTWMANGSFVNATERVELSSGRFEGEITANGSGPGGAFAQTWAEGGTCAVCGGMLGPTGQEACEDPYLGGVP